MYKLAEDGFFARWAVKNPGETFSYTPIFHSKIVMGTEDRRQKTAKSVFFLENNLWVLGKWI